jgi:hypothetical protein
MPNQWKLRYHTENIRSAVKLLKQNVPNQDRNKGAGEIQTDFHLPPDSIKCLHSEGEGMVEKIHLLVLTDFQRHGLPDSAYLSDNCQMN